MAYWKYPSYLLVNREKSDTTTLELSSQCPLVNNTFFKKQAVRLALFRDRSGRRSWSRWIQFFPVHRRNKLCLSFLGFVHFLMLPQSSVWNQFPSVWKEKKMIKGGEGGFSVPWCFIKIKWAARAVASWSCRVGTHRGDLAQRMNVDERQRQPSIKGSRGLRSEWL